MNSVSFFRVFKSGFVNFWRNIWLSAAATMVMVITLIILSVLLLLFMVTSSSVTTIKERVDISAYFKTGLAEAQIMSIKAELESNPLIKEVHYTSAEQAFADFKNRHANDPLITESLNELSQNPLPATLQVKAVSLDSYPAIAQDLQSDKYKSAIETVNFEDNRVIIDRLNRILKFIVSFGIILTAIFSIIAILVIFNTITLTIYNRREEIEIMRLVGATNGYIRGPFIVEAMLYSLAATVITGAIIVPLYTNLLPKVSNYLNPGSMALSNGFVSLPVIIALQLGIAIILSILSTFLATRKYLKI